MVIQFSHPKPKQHLTGKGYVFTYRVHKRKGTGKNWASSGRGKKKICNVNINHLKEITMLSELYPFVYGSGFKNLQEWLDAIININGKFPSLGHLYLVSVIGRKECNERG